VIETVTDIVLLAFLAITAIAINRIRNLFAVIMLFGIFSLLSAGLFVILDAADVAFTEAAVGAGISTVLMLATLALTKDHEEKPPKHGRPCWLALVVVLVTGSALIYGTIDIPDFGDPQAPAQQHDPLSRGVQLIQNVDQKQPLYDRVTGEQRFQRQAIEAAEGDVGGGLDCEVRIPVEDPAEHVAFYQKPHDMGTPVGRVLLHPQDAG